MMFPFLKHYHSGNPNPTVLFLFYFPMKLVVVCSVIHYLCNFVRSHWDVYMDEPNFVTFCSLLNMTK